MEGAPEADRRNLLVAAAIMLAAAAETKGFQGTADVGMAILIAGVALAGAATLWNRLPSGGAPADEPPAAAA
jgi:hypothetical protein